METIDLIFCLEYLAGFDASDIDDDEFEMLGETEEGQSVCSTCSITEIAGLAAKKLKELEK